MIDYENLIEYDLEQDLVLDEEKYEKLKKLVQKNMLIDEMRKSPKELTNETITEKGENIDTDVYEEESSYFESTEGSDESSVEEDEGAEWDEDNHMNWDDE